MLDFLLSMACLLFLNDCSKEKGGVSLFLPRVPQGSILGALFILIFFIIHLSSLLTPTVFSYSFDEPPLSSLVRLSNLSQCSPS